jgi:hypothetical protein
MIKLTGTLALSTIFFLSSCSEPKTFKSLTQAETKNEQLDVCQDVYMWEIERVKESLELNGITAEKASVMIENYRMKSGKILAQMDFFDADYENVKMRMLGLHQNNMIGGDYYNAIRDNSEIVLGHCGELIGYTA